MADVRVPVEDFERGTTPRVCIVSGEAAESSLDCQVDNLDGCLPFALFLLGIIPGLLYIAIVRKTAVGSLPLSADAAAWAHAARRRRGRGRAAAVLVVGATTFGVLTSIGDGLFVPTAGAILAMVVILLVLPSASSWVPVRVSIESSGRWIVIHGAADAFAAAMAAKLVGPQGLGAMPPGWHPDPWDPSRQRWWDGSGWSDQTS